MSDFYAHEYRTLDSPFFLDYKRLSKPFTNDYRSMSQILLGLQFIHWKSGDLFVDVGPGKGSSFDSAIRILENPRLLAVEYAQGAREAFRRVYNAETVECLSECSTKEIRKPKLLLSSHSLEHFTVNGAREFLTEVGKYIDNEGALVLEVPHVDLRTHSDKRTADSPHFLFFSKQSLQLLIEDCGFEILFLDSCCDSFTEEISYTPVEVIKKFTVSSITKYYIKSIASWLGLSPSIDFTNPNFHYGGDRACLRLVAKPIVRR